MFSKTKAKHFALGLMLTLALAVAPQALAGPTFGGDVGGTVVGFFADLWQSVLSFVGDDDSENFGPLATPNASESGDDLGPMVIPNGDHCSQKDPGQELGPMQIPNG